MTATPVLTRNGLGPLRPTRARAGDFPPIAKAFVRVSQEVRDAGLFRRAPLFYLLVGIAIAAAFGGVVTGFILLGDSWFQLLMAGALGIVGVSYGWWDSKHTRHHANPNRVGKDPDIEVDTISFVEEDAAEARGLRRAITRRQGWLFFPLLSLEGLNLHAHSARYLASREPVKHRWTEIGLIAARFALLLTPLFLVLPLGMAFAFLGVQLAVFGIYMGASFAPNHKGMPIIARARRIVREHCRALDVPYTEVSLLRSYAIVIEYLNRVGLAARDPFECPISAQYR